MATNRQKYFEQRSALIVSSGADFYPSADVIRILGEENIMGKVRSPDHETLGSYKLSQHERAELVAAYDGAVEKYGKSKAIGTVIRYFEEQDGENGLPDVSRTLVTVELHSAGRRRLSFYDRFEGEAALLGLKYFSPNDDEIKEMGDYEKPNSNEIDPNVYNGQLNRTQLGVVSTMPARRLTMQRAIENHLKEIDIKNAEMQSKPVDVVSEQELAREFG